MRIFLNGIAAGTAALTAGLTQGLEGVVQSSAEAVNAGNATITQRAISTLSQNNLATALAESAVSNVSSTAAQSSINGDSFSEALESQGSNILIGAVGNLGAQEIGSAFKSGNISRAKQLTLHSALGCGTALAGGGDCASGALSGVSGELAGEYVKDNLYPGQTTSSLTGQQKTVIKELGGLAGGLSAIFTGNAVGLSESEIADNIFSGQRIGKNAVENNLLTSLIIGGGVVLAAKGEGNPIKGAKEVYEDVKYLAGNISSLSDQEIRENFILESKEKANDLYNNYDYNFGVQANLLTVGGSYGTDGKSVVFHANPTIGLELYGSILPKGESPVSSTTYNPGPLKIISGSSIITNEGKPGIGASIGGNITLFPVPGNLSFIIPENKRD
jgi:hypothetical protein